MADVQFHHLRNGRDRAYGFIGDTVADMHLQPQRMRIRRPFDQGRQFGVTFGKAALFVHVTVMARVQFHHSRADPGTGFDLSV